MNSRLSAGKARPKAKGTSRASKPHKLAKSKSPPKAGTKAKPDAREARPLQLLSGGNPRIAKADGDAPVQAYIAGLSGWKRDVGRRLDALIERNVPEVRKAVKWNSPLYGIADQGWFLGIHTFRHYIKVAFFHGTSLRPIPPGASKDKGTRYVDIREGELDEAQLATWVKQAARVARLAPEPTQLDANHSDEATMKHSGDRQAGTSAAQLISKRIAELGDWRGETLGRIRALIKEAAPDILEEWKWRGTPVWSHDGIVCTGETYKNVVKMTFAKGASLKDPAHLFNSSLDGNVRRAIDLHEGEAIDAPALKALIRAAVALNASGKKATPPKRGGR
jgi:hypothetical protein